MAGPYVELLLAEAHPAAPGSEVVDLLGDRVVVLGRLAGRTERRFGQRLVHGRRPRRMGQLADRRAVNGDERLE